MKSGCVEEGNDFRVNQSSKLAIAFDIELLLSKLKRITCLFQLPVPIRLIDICTQNCHEATKTSLTTMKREPSYAARGHSLPANSI